MNKNREKALEGLTRIAQVIVSDKYHDESNEVINQHNQILLTKTFEYKKEDE
jgi:hypothetical protein